MPINTNCYSWLTHSTQLTIDPSISRPPISSSLCCSSRFIVGITNDHKHHYSALHCCLVVRRVGPLH